MKKIKNRTNTVVEQKETRLAYPYALWSVIFIVVPLVLIVYYSLTRKTDDGGILFTFENYRQAFDPLFLKVFMRSFVLAGIATILCVIIGYPAAYIISKANVDEFPTEDLCLDSNTWKKWIVKFSFGVFWYYTKFNPLYKFCSTTRYDIQLFTLHGIANIYVSTEDR